MLLLGSVHLQKIHFSVAFLVYQRVPVRGPWDWAWQKWRWMASAPSSRWKPSGFHTLNHQPISIGKNVFHLTFSNLYVLCFFKSCGWFHCFFWGVLWSRYPLPIVKRSWKWWTVVVPRKTAAFVPWDLLEKLWWTDENLLECDRHDQC